MLSWPMPVMQTKTALSRLTREKEQADALLLQAEHAKATAEVDLAEVSGPTSFYPKQLLK